MVRVGRAGRDRAYLETSKALRELLGHFMLSRLHLFYPVFKGEKLKGSDEQMIQQKMAKQDL